MDQYGNKVDESGVADLTMVDPNVFANLGAPAQVSFNNGVSNPPGFIQIYTAGSSVIQATVTAKGFFDRSTGTITAGDYSANTGRVLLLAPGEVVLPGSPAAPGKDSVSISTVVANTSMSYTLLLCDRFYNLDTTYTGNHFSLSSDDLAIDLTDIAVNSGSTTVNNVFLNGNLPNPSTVKVTAADQNNANKTSVSNVPVTPGAAYVVTVPAAATVGAIFQMTVELIDPNTGLPMVGANNAIALEALTSSGTPTAVPLGVQVMNLNNGSVTFQQSYGNVETIKIRVTDSFNRLKDSGNITVNPNGLLYRVTLPGTPTTADDVFPVTVGLYDSVQQNVLIRGAGFQHSFNISVATSAGGPPAAGTIPVNSGTLVNGEATFSFSYTKAENIIVSATGTLAGYPPIIGSANITIRPGAYVKLQIVAPDEVEVPGVPSLTGKNSANLRAQGTKDTFNIVVNAVDRYWNTVTSLNTPNDPTVRLTASDGSLGALPQQPFINGQALFAGVSLNSPPQVTVTADDRSNVNLFPQSVVIPLNGRAYVAELISAPPYYSGSTIDFHVTLHQYVNGSTEALIVNNLPKVTITPMTPTLQPLAVDNLSIERPGTVGANNVVQMVPLLNLGLKYQVAENVRFKFTDEDGWQGFSSTISFIPNGVDYVLTFPAESRVGPPDTFSMTLTPRDKVTHTTAINFSTSVTITPVSPSGVPLAGVLQKTNALIDGGAQTFQQGFSQSGVFYFTVSDGVNTTTSTTMNFLPGPLASIDATLSAVLDAGVTETVRVTLLDAYANPIPSTGVTLELSDPSFGTLSPTDAVTNVYGQVFSTFTTSSQKSGTGEFRAVSGNIRLAKVFRLLGPPTTSLRVLGFGVEEEKGYAVKPGDDLYFDFSVQAGLDPVSVSYSIDGAATQILNIFVQQMSGVYSFGPIQFNAPGQHTIEYFGVTQSTSSGVFHTETTRTSKPIFVSAVTTPEEGLVNYPNPFRAGRDLTFLEYTLLADAGVRLTIYDMMGQRVYERGYSQGEEGGSSGFNRVSWDGRNGDGVVVGNGGYVAVLEGADGTKLNRKIAVKK
ncbi:MAG: Ig-like domain-containing protein [Elusimicrobia bacterium]|nr:Ig-like domain-containing protein [Elusimicrobiota bacterium]